MPLLKRKAFEKSTASEYLRDEDEVFHCEVTDEIFKDYEEYCERIILVNSMVWSCEMTGKNNLTYAEALESEKVAKRSLRDFPMELRIPILYLASHLKRYSFASIYEDVFNFVRERYFIGETVEACLEGDIWHEAHVLSVTAQKQPPGSKEIQPASSYCYEVEQFNDKDAAAEGQMGTAPAERVRRRKGVFTRDKCRLFLKQFVEQGPQGTICIKKSALEKYNIHKTSFDQIFTGNPPDFPSPKKVIKLSLSPAASQTQSNPSSASKNKSAKKPTPQKGKQESMDKFVKKTDKTEAKPKPPVDPSAKKNAQELANKMRKAEELMKQRKEDEKAKEKEKTARLQAYLKEWQKAKDDLDLEDQKVIPKGTLIDIEGISQKNIGDFLSVLDFVYVYADTLKVKDVFHNDFDIETFRKALTLKEHAGTFSDLIQMFLTTIFSLQEDEAEEYNENGGIQLSTEVVEIEQALGATKAVELATKASKWSQTYLGTPLSKLPLDPTTVSEVLRLHILSSGAVGGRRCATWRYQQRGGYASADDAGLYLRVQHPHLLRRLANTHVADLNLDDKFLVLQCLMNQVLSYATVRDIIEEKVEQLKNAKHSLRMLHANERKRELQLVSQKQEIKKEFMAKKEEQKLTGDKAKELEEERKVAFDKLMKENEDKKHEYEKKVKTLQTEIFDHTSYLGSDRGYRRYWVVQKVAGVFVEAGAEPRGPCRDKPLLPAPMPPDGDSVAYATQLFYKQREQAGSDKENDSAANSRGNSPKKPFMTLNGISNKLNGLESTTHQLKDLLMCTGDINSCGVHGKIDRPQWWVYHTEEHIEGLIQSLNKRGFRESELRQTLEMDKANILEYIKKCPLRLLNPKMSTAPAVHPMIRQRKFQPSLKVPDDCSLSEALELSLRDHILELEEKIFHGCLGVLKVKDREAWRGTIMLRGYDKQAEYLTWGPDKQYRDDYHLPNGVLKVPQDIDESDIKTIPQNKYRDPGHYLELPKGNGIKQEVKVEEAVETVPNPEVVRGLSSALLQVSQAIHHKYIKRPLGLDDKERKEREAKSKPLDLEALERWEVSLMECRSFSQIVLHLFTLDSSITWSASILNASCRLCRRKTDPDNMLLCDGCNKGHHLYCLKPKLTKVPAGDWYCDQCRPKERTPRKRRKLFNDEDIKKALDDSSDSSSNSESDSEGVDTGVCGECGSGGRLSAVCSACEARYHPECAVPRPTRQAKRWVCASCLAPAAAQAPPTRNSYDSEDNLSLGRLKGKRGRSSKEPSPLLNGHATGRSRKSKDEINTSKKSKSSLTNGTPEETKKKKNRKRSGRQSPEEEAIIHLDALEVLLRDVMRHKDCWPFYDAVNTDEVPDYLDVIEIPMDFTTIKAKFEGGAYTTDQELIDDCAVVFYNCFTYNQATHLVAKAGVRLEKYFNKRCTELELPTLPEIIVDSESTASKRPSPVDDLEDQPKTKKTKHK